MSENTKTTSPQTAEETKEEVKFEKRMQKKSRISEKHFQTFQVFIAPYGAHSA